MAKTKQPAQPAEVKRPILRVYVDAHDRQLSRRATEIAMTAARRSLLGNEMSALDVWKQMRRDCRSYVVYGGCPDCNMGTCKIMQWPKV